MKKTEETLSKLDYRLFPNKKKKYSHNIYLLNNLYVLWNKGKYMLVFALGGAFLGSLTQHTLLSIMGTLIGGIYGLFFQENNAASSTYSKLPSKGEFSEEDTTMRRRGNFDKGKKNKVSLNASPYYWTSENDLQTFTLNRVFKRGEHTIALICGGAFLGGLIAQITGAIIGGLVGAILSIFTAI